MAETRIIRVSAACLADRATRARSGGSRPWRDRLWALLNAQALIRGTAGAPGDVAFVEDDRHRLSRRSR
jgi:hypothetical protein